jgi:hypothetical protein
MLPHYRHFGRGVSRGGTRFDPTQHDSSLENAMRKSKPPLRSSWLQAAVVVLVATAAVIGTTVAPRAFDQHFIECLGWMLTDPELHAANCGPSRVPGLGIQSMITDGEDSSPPSPDELCDTFDVDDGDASACDFSDDGFTEDQE